jgi:hypothetical protein
MTDTTTSAATAKSALASRTLWFNAIVAAIAGADQWLGALQPLLGAHAWQVLTVLAAVANVVLRALTTQPLALPARADPAAPDVV